MTRYTIDGIGELQREVITPPWGDEGSITVISDPDGILTTKAVTRWTLSAMQTATFGFGVAIGAALGLLV